MNKFENQYRNNLLTAMNEGTEREDRTGVGCKSIFNASLEWDLSIGKFPMITGRRIYPKVFNTEFDWFINGETNIARFRKNNVKIWDAWADEQGNLGPVYGHQMKNFNSQGIDQLQSLLEQLKTNPDSRRHIISLWNPAQLADMALPPCYLYFQFFVEKGGLLNMFVVQRSADMLLGIPYDVCLFSKLLLYVAEQTNLKAHKVNLQMIDAHVYSNQIEAVNDFLSQDTYDMPSYTYENGVLKLSDYKYASNITAAVAV